MESLDLTYKLIALKIKVKLLTESTLCLKYFKNIVIAMVMTKGKNREIKTTKVYFFFAATPSLLGRRGLLQPPPPPLQIFSWQKCLNIFFFFIDAWVSGKKGW